MKKFLFASLVALISIAASADGIVTETETLTTVEVVEYNYDAAPRYVSSAQVVPHKRKCVANVAEPVRVKTHTEVIEHYQLYQPVTVYQPVGRVSQRRIIRAPMTCRNCN